MKPRFLPKFPIFVQDWLSSLRIQAMSAEERGGFLHLCLLQWTEGGLPAEEALLLKLAGIPGSTGVHPLLVEAFPLGQDGQRRNEKVAVVRAEAEAYCESQAEKGRASGRARNHGSTGVQPKSNRRRTQSNPPTPTPTPTPETDLHPSTDSDPAAGKPPRASKPRAEPTGPAADCRRHWDSEWQRTRLGTSWSWNARDASAVAKILKDSEGASPAEVQIRMTRMLEDQDGWVTKNARPAMLEDRWNQFAVQITNNNEPKGFATLRALSEKRP